MGKAKSRKKVPEGKKPANTAVGGGMAKRTAMKAEGAASAAVAKTKVPSRNPGHISNRLKRSEMYGKYLQQKRTHRKEMRLQREREVEELGEEGGADGQSGTGGKTTTMKPRTIDNTREVEPTMVSPDDEEVAGDEADDEFAPYFDGTAVPKVLITTRPRPSRHLFYFVADLQQLVPALHYYPRKSYSVKEICQFAANRGFTHLIVLTEKSKKCNGMTISHLRRRRDDDDEDGAESTLGGPTAHFKLTNVVTSQNIPNHGASTSHIPELHLHGFGTRLGHRVGRLLASLFPTSQTQLEGRQVVTFHNQRDYVFVRHHRYIFRDNEKKTKKEVGTKKAKQKGDDVDPGTAGGDGSSIKDDVGARLQELGPRFTLKLRWLQEGTFDTKFGEYEWYHKRKEMDTTRRKFHL